MMPITVAMMAFVTAALFFGVRVRVSVSSSYFDKSASWFYHKMDGIDGNGGTGGFNQQETEQMRGALIDLSNRIRRAAENI